MLLPTGFGDGGGGPTPSMAERARRLANLAEMPRTRWGRIDDFFADLQKRRDVLPTWRGEMYVEGHKATLTTNGRLKATYRAAERALQAWEAVRCAKGGGPIPIEPWKRVVFTQFHDVITGTSVQEAYEELLPELEQLAADALAAARHELTDDSGQSDCVFNPLPMSRLAEVDGKLVTLPALAGVAVSELKALHAQPTRQAGLRLTNERVDVSFTEDGTIASLEIDGESVATRGECGRLTVAPDHPPAHDAWDTEASSFAAAVPLTALRQVDGDRDEIAFAGQTPGGSDVTVRYRLSPMSPVVEVCWELDWKETQRIVRASFATGYDGESARYGAPFGSCLRSQRGGTLAEAAQYENPMSRWSIALDGGQRRGLFLVTKDKYAGGCRDGTLSLTLLRSPLYNDTHDERQLRDLDAYGGTAWQTHTDLCRHEIHAAIGLFNCDAPADEQPATLADTLYTPPIRYRGRPCDAGLGDVAWPTGVTAAWAKPVDAASWLLRCHDTLGTGGTLDVPNAVACRADGQATDASPLKPYGIATLKLTR